MRIAAFLPIALTLPSCTVAASSDAPLASSSEALVADASAGAAWSDLTIDGADCAELGPPISITTGADASFLLGMGANVAAGARAERRCAVRASLVVPEGQYVTSLTYTLGYGAEKPQGARFAIDADARLFAPRGGFGDDVIEPRRVVFDDAFAERTVVHDVSASRHWLCRARAGSPVAFASRVTLRYVAAPKAGGLLDVDSIDVHADVAPCPAR